MKKIFKALNFTLTLLFMLLAFIACDTEYNSIESDVLSKENFNFATADSSFSVVAYNQKLAAQQINGLPSNLLGFYNDPNYGKTTASIVTQLLPTLYDPTLGLDKQIESVILTIPYYSTQIDLLTTGEPIYRLDSLFVENNNIEDNTKKIRLTVYENKYFLRNFSITDPEGQNYFSNSNLADNNGDNSVQTETGIINFEDYTGIQLCDTLFTPRNEARELVTGEEDNETTSYLRPAIELNLSRTLSQKAFWQFMILDQEGQSSLSNTNNFLEHFRGLYIKAEAVDGEGNMMMLNLLDTDANIVINYTTDDDNDDERESKTYTLNFSGNILNTFINDYAPDVIPSVPDTENGDEKLYIKGNEGALAVIELFNDDDTKKIDCNCGKDSNGQDIIVNVTELECFKKTYRQTDDNGEELAPVNGQYQLKRLLNEAHLVVYEDKSISDNTALNEFNRLYIYDLKNNVPLLDYQSDPSVNTSNPLNSRSFSLGSRIEEEENDDDQNSVKYKLKLTDHLLNILIRDADNPKLGLTLSNNVNITTNTELINSDITGIPATSVISPRGTILYGSGNTEEEKSVKLKLFYTETN